MIEGDTQIDFHSIPSTCSASAQFDLITRLAIYKLKNKIPINLVFELTAEAGLCTWRSTVNSIGSRVITVTDSFILLHTQNNLKRGS